MAATLAEQMMQPSQIQIHITDGIVKVQEAAVLLQIVKNENDNIAVAMFIGISADSSSYVSLFITYFLNTPEKSDEILLKTLHQFKDFHS